MDTRKLTLLVEKMRPDAVLPSKGSDQASGFDLTILEKYKDVDEDVTIYHTGLKATIAEPGWDLRILPRSSMSKIPYMLANTEGVIDQDYRGEILVAIRRLKNDASPLTLPLKCVQLIPSERPGVNVVECQLDETVRGAGGFGSTDQNAS